MAKYVQGRFRFVDPFKQSSKRDHEPIIIRRVGRSEQRYLNSKMLLPGVYMRPMIVEQQCLAQTWRYQTEVLCLSRSLNIVQTR